MSETNRDPELSALEAALTQLAPLPPPLSRERLLFQAGQRAGARPGRFWPAASAALALLSVVLGSALLLRPEPPTREYVVYVPVPGPAPAPPVPPLIAPAPFAAEPMPVAPAAEDRPNTRDYVLLRRKVMEQGVEACRPFPGRRRPLPGKACPICRAASSPNRVPHRRLSP